MSSGYAVVPEGLSGVLTRLTGTVADGLGEAGRLGQGLDLVGVDFAALPGAESILGEHASLVAAVRGVLDALATDLRGDESLIAEAAKGYVECDEAVAGSLTLGLPEFG